MLSSDISWQHSDTTHQHPVYPPHPHPNEWDMSFAAAADFDASPSTVLPVAEPAYDLFSTNPQHASFRFRSDSSSSEAENASPGYLYQQPSRPSTSYSAAPTIAPDAVAPPSLAELMMDSSRHSSVSASGPSDLGFSYQQQQQQQQPPQPHRGFSFDASAPIVRPTLRASNTFPTSAFPTMQPDTMIKREEAPYHFAYPTDGHDVHAYVRPHLDRYINSPNRSGAGECSIIVMSSKVAQKSYGTEKRFLCPPPTAIMIGNNWWSENRRGDVVPPKAVISISGEPSPLESLTEWSTPAGKNFDISEAPLAARENGSTTFMGRCIGKQLFISDVDERKKKVEALVKVVVPADDPTLPDPEPERLIGVFPSKPIKVISKPSKKRQSAKNLELCINHGSTVSLFHRLRAQTVSTKYLCVSGSSSAFKGSDGQPLPGTVKQNAPPSFVAKTACWESFVIYIIDLNKPTGPDAVPPPPPHPDYPSPPPNAIPYNNNGMCTPIYYNQTVVLQCLVSGVVSPPLIIRKVEQGTTVVGGGLMEGVKGIPDHYCAPGEVCGDPVSQLHKIALEVYDPSNASRPIHHVLDPSSPGQSGSFLSCMGEKVNTYRPSEDRQWNGQHADSSESSGHSPSLPDSPVLNSPTSPNAPDYYGNAAISNDGGRVKTRTKRNSLSTGPKITSKGRRRLTSASTSSSRQSSASETTMTSGALWSVDVGETAVWTVVGTDIARYDFFIPPSSPYGAAPVGYPANGDASTPSSMLSSPPSSLTQPITPMPLVAKYLPPERASELPKMPGSGRTSLHHHHHHHHSTKMDGSNGSGVGKMLTVYGENFNKSDPVTVYFGSEPSPHTEVRCAEVINCLPPSSVVQQQQQQMASGSPTMIYPRPIVLVRNDGVVFPTKVMYP